MRTMYDAVTAANITRANTNPQLVAGYIDKIKLEPWSAADWARFPNARKVTIVKKASTRAGHVLDVEPGDATPEQAPGWARQRRADGFAYPVIYCNRSTWPKVKAAFVTQNVAPPLYWIATASGTPTIPAGAIAAQYRLDYQGVDVSVVADFWPGVDGPGTEDDVALTDEERNWLGTTYGDIALGGGDSPLEVGMVHALAEVRQNVRDLKTKVDAVQSSPEIDYAKLAAALIAAVAK